MKGLKNKFRLTVVRHGIFFSLLVEMFEMWVLLATFRILAYLMAGIIRLFPLDGGPFEVLDFITNTNIVMGFILLCAFYIFRNVSHFRK